MTMRKRQGILMWDLISQNSPFPETLPGKGLNIRSIYFSLFLIGQCRSRSVRRHCQNADIVNSHKTSVSAVFSHREIPTVFF